MLIVTSKQISIIKGRGRLIGWKSLFQSVIPVNYIKIRDNVSKPKVFINIQKERFVSRPYTSDANMKIYVRERDSTIFQYVQWNCILISSCRQ